MNRISLNHFKERWREKNRHNTTIAGNVFNINKVYVGNYTYGTINCLTWGCGNEILKIGNLCSIAQEVMFILSADHYTNHVSSYPFMSKMQLGDGGLDANPKGNNQGFHGEEYAKAMRDVLAECGIEGITIGRVE